MRVKCVIDERCLVYGGAEGHVGSMNVGAVTHGEKQTGCLANPSGYLLHRSGESGFTDNFRWSLPCPSCFPLCAVKSVGGSSSDEGPDEVVGNTELKVTGIRGSA